MAFDGRAFLLGGGTRIIRNPREARREFTRVVTRPGGRTGGGGGGGSGGGGTPAPLPPSTVTIDGTNVVIDGVGYSVAPNLQAEFIRGKTRGGQSAQDAISKANIIQRDIMIKERDTKFVKELREKTREKTRVGVRAGRTITDNNIRKIDDKAIGIATSFQKNVVSHIQKNVILPVKKFTSSLTFTMPEKEKIITPFVFTAEEISKRRSDMTQEELKKSDERIKDLQKKPGKLTFGKILKGSLINAPKRRVEDLKKAIQVPIQTIGLISKTVGKSVEKAAGFLPASFGRSTQKITTPSFGTVTDTAPQGFTQTKVTTDVFNPKTAGKVAQFTTGGTLLLATPAIVLAPGFIVGGTEKALDKDLSTGERALGGVEAGIGAFIVGSKVLEVAKTPVTIVKTKNILNEPKIIELQKGGKSGFVRLTQTKPETVTIETSIGRQLFGLAPKKDPVLKDAEFVLQFSTSPVKAGEPFVVAETKVGSSALKFSKAASASEKTVTQDKNILSFIETEKGLERSTFKDVESFLGKKLSDAPTIIDDLNKRYTSVGVLKDVKNVKVTPRTLTEKPLPSSKTKLSLSVSDVEKLGEGKLGEIFEIRTSSRDIKTLFPRTSAKTTEESGILVRLSDKPEAGSEIGTQIGKGSGTGLLKFKDPESTALISSLVKAPKSVKAPSVTIIGRRKSILDFGGNVVPKVATKTTSPLILKTRVQSTTPAPVSTAPNQVGITTSLGETIQLETPSKVDLSGSRVSTGNIFTVTTSLSEKQSPFQVIPGIDVRQAGDSITDTKQDSDTGSIQIVIPKPKQDTIQETIIVPDGTVPGKPISPIIKTKLTRLTIPIVPKPISPDIPGDKKKKKKIVFKQGFIAQVKEKGKWRNVTKKPRTRREALMLAGNVVDNSTAVQLRLKKTKKSAIKETTTRRIKRHKYRDYSIRAGKRAQLPNSGLIEKKKNRIDTIGEKKGLSAGKALKSNRFLSLLRRKRK